MGLVRLHRIPGQCVAGNRSVDGQLTSTVQPKTPPMPGARTNWRARRRHGGAGARWCMRWWAPWAPFEQSSRKIVDIISVIDGIAFQTNIPALNAAVKPPVPGTKAVGFAVVASECAAWHNAVQQPPRGDQDPDRRFRGKSRNRHPAGRARRNHHGRVVGREERRTAMVAEISAASGSKALVSPRSTRPSRRWNGAHRRSPGGRALAAVPVAEPAGLALSQVVGKFRVA